MTERVYPLATYADRDSVKALGVRHDGERRRCFVPPGADLAPFAAWLPEELRASVVFDAVDIAHGISLEQPMGRLGQAVAPAVRSGE